MSVRQQKLGGERDRSKREQKEGRRIEGETMDVDQDKMRSRL